MFALNDQKRGITHEINILVLQICTNYTPMLKNPSPSMVPEAGFSQSRWLCETST